MQKIKIVDVLSWMGMMFVLCAYFFNSLGYLSADTFLYPLLNLFGALFLSIDVFVKKSYASLALQMVWGGISLFAIAKILF